MDRAAAEERVDDARRGPRLAICEAGRLSTKYVPELESARLRLRGWRDEDAGSYRPILRDPQTVRYLGTGPRFTARRMALSAVARVSDLETRRAIRAMQRHWERHGLGHWAVELKQTDELIGRVGFHYHPDWLAGPDKIEIGWTLISRAWGNGFATEAASCALGHGFDRYGLDRVISIASHDNVRSLRVMERLGMTLQGEAHWRRSNWLWYAIGPGEWLRPARAARAGAHR